MTALAPGDLVAIPVRPGVTRSIWIVTASAEGDYQFFVMNGAEPASMPGGPGVWKGWFRGRVPRDFEVVGTRSPTKKQRAVAAAAEGTMVFGTAERLRAELLRTWRLTHDRAALEAEWAAHDQRAKAAVAARRASLTLPQLLRERLFATWREDAPLRAVRRIFRDATKQLIALEAQGTPRERTAVLKRITTALNALDDTEGFIETVEREDLVAQIEELARLVGVRNTRERLTGHRDW